MTTYPRDPKVLRSHRHRGPDRPTSCGSENGASRGRRVSDLRADPRAASAVARRRVRLGLDGAVKELLHSLAKIRAEVENADLPPHRAELVDAITTRVCAFIQSCLAGVRGDGIGSARPLTGLGRCLSDRRVAAIGCHLPTPSVENLWFPKGASKTLWLSVHCNPLGTYGIGFTAGIQPDLMKAPRRGNALPRKRGAFTRWRFLP